MQVGTDDFVLNSIEYENMKLRKCPQEAHKKISEMMISEIIRDEDSYLGAELWSSIETSCSSEESIDSLREHEENRSIEAISFKNVKDAFDTMDIVDTEQNCSIKQPKREKTNLKEVETWAKTFDFPTSSDDTTPLFELKIIIGHRKITICSTYYRVIKFKFMETENGTMFFINDFAKFIEGYHYYDLAAKRFIRIVRKLLAKPTLKSLTFEFEPRETSDPIEYHNTMFIDRIKEWMRDQLNLDPLRRLHTTSFSMMFYRNGTRERFPFDLTFLQPNVLEWIILRTWDDGHITRRVEKPTYLNGWDRTDQWRGAMYLDISDNRLNWFYPDTRWFHVVLMYSWTHRHAFHFTQVIYTNPLLQFYTITSPVDFVPLCGRDETLTAKIPLPGDRDCIRMEVSRDRVTYEILPKSEVRDTLETTWRKLGRIIGIRPPHLLIVLQNFRVQ